MDKELEKGLEKEVNKKIRAVYIGDVRFDNCPVFELDVETNLFYMVSDPDFTYDDLSVYDDKDFLVFEVTTVNSNILKRGSSTEYEKEEYVKQI